MTAEFLGIALILAILAALLVAIPLWSHRSAQSSARSSIIPIVLVLIIPLAVLALYAQVTTYPWDNPERLTAQPAANAPMTDEQILGMVSQLEERMAEEPTVEGLAMLGRSYVNLQRTDDAVDAWHRAWTLSKGSDPGVSLGYAEALLLADRNTIMTSAGDLLDSVLEALPDNPKALWYGGMSSVARGNTQQAQQRLAHLLNQPDIPEQLRTVVQQQLAALGDPSSAAPAAADAPADATEAGAQLTVTIEIDPELRGQVSDTAVLFVFARETGQAGPPAAVKRIPAPSFPLTVTLTDADRMMPTNMLSGVQNLSVVARLSHTGDATAASGDLYGEIQPDWPGAAARVRINSIVP